jgi:C4-dicarboxylate-specific signal transduction histidine kinase
MSNADWFEPEDLQIMKAAWKRVFEEGYGKAELNLKMKDGRLVPYALTGVSLVIDGKPHLVGIGMDISDRIQAEGSVAQLRAEMTRVSRVNTLGELTSGLAHELNQPLAAILSNAQAARRFLAAETPDLDEVRAAVEDIIRDDKRAGEIVHGLRALVGKNQSRSELVDLNKLIRAVADLIHGELIAFDVPLSLELDPNLPEVLAGQIEIQQVVLNFLLNGIQAQHEVAPSRRQLLVKTWHEPDTVVAAVCDKGTGLSEENLSRVFDPFFTTKNQGLGMGLAICRRIAESYQGRVWAENNPDGGASFCIALSVAKESS